METNEYENILRELLRDLSDALKKHKASAVARHVLDAYITAQRKANEQERREALNRP